MVIWKKVSTAFGLPPSRSFFHMQSQGRKKNVKLNLLLFSVFISDGIKVFSFFHRNLNWKHQGGWEIALNYFLRIKLRYSSRMSGMKSLNLCLSCFALFCFKAFLSKNIPPYAQHRPVVLVKERGKTVAENEKHIFMIHLADFLRNSFSRVEAFLGARWNRFELNNRSVERKKFKSSY